MDYYEQFLISWFFVFFFFLWCWRIFYGTVVVGDSQLVAAE